MLKKSLKKRQHLIQNGYNKGKSIFRSLSNNGSQPLCILPDTVLASVFLQANKDKGKIPVKMKIDGHEFNQTLIKYSGHWRLYLNTPIRKMGKKRSG